MLNGFTDISVENISTVCNNNLNNITFQFHYVIKCIVMQVINISTQCEKNNGLYIKKDVSIGQHGIPKAPKFCHPRGLTS